MPQSERSEIMKQIMKWLKAKTITGGASWQECVRQIQIEITDMGAEENRCRTYLRDLERVGLIHIHTDSDTHTHTQKYKITETGKCWLERKDMIPLHTQIETLIHTDLSGQGEAK